MHRSKHCPLHSGNQKMHTQRFFFGRKTVDLCQKVEHAGVSWVAVHGRTKEQRADAVNYEAIKLVKESLTVPVIANGDICNTEDISRVCELTGADGMFPAKTSQIFKRV